LPLAFAGPLLATKDLSLAVMGAPDAVGGAALVTGGARCRIGQPGTTKHAPPMVVKLLVSAAQLVVFGQPAHDRTSDAVTLDEIERQELADAGLVHLSDEIFGHNAMRGWRPWLV
jgi:hypothetical protein